MICPRCGAEMKPEQRYCMKCGALNYDHPDNQKMKGYITEEELEKAKQNYIESNTVGKDAIEIGGQVYANNPKEEKRSTYVDTRAALGLGAVIAIVLGLVCYFYFPFSLLMSFAVAFTFFLIVFYVLVFISLFMKGGYSGFTPLIPFYNLYAYYDIAVGNGWLFLVTLIPIVGMFFSFYASYKMGKVFGKSGWLTLFFPFVMLPIIAYSDRAIYDGKGKKYQKYLEKGKRRNTKLPGFIYSGVIFLVFFFLLESPVAFLVGEMFLTYDVERAYSRIRKDVDDGVYSCDSGDINSEDGVYYIYYDDIKDAFMTPFPVRSSLNGKSIYGYVQVSRNGNSYRYVYAMTDGDNIVSNDSSISDALEVEVPEGANVCKKS